MIAFEANCDPSLEWLLVEKAVACLREVSFNQQWQVTIITIDFMTTHSQKSALNQS